MKQDTHAEGNLLRGLIIVVGVIFVGVIIKSLVFADASWETVGTARFSTGDIKYTSLVFPSGSTTPYVAYTDSSDGSDRKVTVMKYDGSSWVAVGTPGFSADWARYVTLAFPKDSATPYVAYLDGGNRAKATVMKYDGSSWVAVGDPGFSDGTASFISLAFPSGSETPYVAYADGEGSRATVKKYDGSAWVTVGDAEFSASDAQYLSIAFPFSREVPYVAYADGEGGKVTMMKFGGIAWEVVGDANFSAGTALYTSIAFPANSFTPYVAYQDQGNSSKATVMKYDGSSWVTVGDAGFSADSVGYTSLAFPSDSETPYVAYRDNGDSNKATVMKYSATVTYTLSFDTQGGSVVADMANKSTGATFALPSFPTRDSYTFKHWNTASDDSGTSYDADASYTMPGGNTTLYAIWQEVVETNQPIIGGGVIPWCSGPQAPGWNASLPDGGCGSTTLSTTTVSQPDPDTQVQQEPDTQIQNQSLCPYYHFVRYLKFGNKGEDVRELQKFLNCVGFALGADGPGAPGEETINFSVRTLQSVNMFQSAYTQDVLSPYSTTTPTGYFAKYSQKKAYGLMKTE